MKQTNNALKYLLAQYRAIFKNAYFKGLTSAVLLTAGMAMAGGAHAAYFENGTTVANGVLDTSDFVQSGSGTVSSGIAGYTETISADQAIDLNKGEWNEFDWQNGTGAAFTGTIIINNGADVSITAHTKKNDGFASTWGVRGLTVTDGASLTITGNNRSEQNILGYVGQANATDGLTGEYGTFEISKNATVTLQNSGIELQTVNISDSTVSISGIKPASYEVATTVAPNDTNPRACWESYSHIMSVGEANTVTDSTINLGHESFFGSSKVTTITGKSVVNFNGQLADLADEVVADGQDEPKGVGYATAMIRASSASDGVIFNATTNADGSIKDKPVINVAENAYGAIYSNTIKLNNTQVNVAKGGTLFLDGNFTSIYSADAGKHAATTLTLRDVTANNQGTIVIGNAVSGGTTTVSSTTDLQGNLENYTNIKVTANGTSTAGHLIISEDQLLKHYDDDNKLLPEGIFASANVGIIIQSAGTGNAALELVGTDADGLDLNKDVSFVSQSDIENYKATPGGAAADDGDSRFYAGKIFIRNNGTIKGEHLVLHKVLDLADTSKLTLDGQILELGDSSYSGGTLSDLGIVAGKAHDEVALNASGDTFTIDGPLDLSRDYYTKDASGDYTTTLNNPGRITGDNLKIGSTTTSGSMSISGGAFVNAGQSLTLTSGSLTVGAVQAADTNADNSVNTDDMLPGNDGKADGWKYFKNGNPSSLTWTGDFKIQGNAGGTEPTIKVTGASGATATLDLTGANVSWGSGSITVQGATDDGDPYHVSATDYFAVGGEGVLTITGNQFSDFLDIQNGDDEVTQTKLTLSGGGVLLVEGAVTGAINFNKFNSTAEASGSVYFNKGGRLVSTGELSLETGVDGNDEGTDVGDGEIQALDLGEGAIIAQGITINNRNPELDAADAALADDVVTVSGGALAVASRLATSNNEIRFEGASLVLGATDFTRYGLSATEGGAVSAAKLTFSGSDSTFEVSTGDWSVGANGTLGDVDIIDSGNLMVGAAHEEYIRNHETAFLQLDNLSLAGNRSGQGDDAYNLLVREGGKLTVNTIQAANTSLAVNGGSLTINGRTLVAADFDNEAEPESLVDLGETDGIAQAGIDLTEATIRVSNQGHFVLGDTAANALVKFQPTATATAEVVEVNEALDTANITLTGGSELRLDFASGTASTINGGTGLTAEQAAMLKTKLGTFEQGSYVNVGQLALHMEYDKDTLTAQWADIKDFVQVESDVVNNDIKQLLVQGITSSDEISGHFGAVEADVVGQNTIRVNGNLGLHKAYDGYFASVVNAGGERSAIGLTLTSYSTVQLEGEGTVGTLQGQGTNTDSTVTFAEGEFFPGTTTVDGDISAMGAITVNNDVNVTGNVTVGAAEINKALSAKNVTLEGGNNGTSLVTGSLTATEVLTVGTATQQNTLTVANGAVTTRDLVLANGSTLQVGFKAEASDNPDTDFNEAANYTGSLEAQTVDLGNGGVIVDPINELSTAMVSFGKFKDASKAQNSMDLGTANGSLYVGNNSVLGLGWSDLASLREYVAVHQQNGALVDYGSIVAVNGQATLGADKGIVMTSQLPDDFKAYMTENKWSLNSYNTVANSVYFGADTAMKVTAEAINTIGAQNNKNALITFTGNAGQLIADGGEILISGEVRANRGYTLFTDGDGAVDVVNVDHTAAEEGEGITVTTENGFLLGELNSTTGGVVTLGVNTNSRAIMAGASDPVYTTLVAYAQGYNGTKDEDTTNGDQTDYLYHGYTEQTSAGKSGEQVTNRVKNYNYDNYFLNESVATGNGASVEAVARLATYGGAVQAAITAGASSYEAISGRMGMGATGLNLTVADNTQGAALWLTPMYKSSESDSFDAEGVDYGVDLNLYGIALGADYTLANGVSFGAMFNVGSGDVDGKDAGSAVSNDFDYYGFGVYGGYSVNNFKVVADLTYTVADNDLQGNTAIDTVGASLDTSNLSLGVTAQYAFDFTAATVTPHAGLRYSYIDMDDYDVDGEGTVATYDGDSLGIFSIPVGVTIAKEFVGDNWSVKPSFDLTLTGNFGDDETDGTVHWAGVENLSTNVSSEVIDNFTYGATLGVAAKTGNFSIGLGVNYTGSSNTDEYGVNANARFVF